MYPDCKNENIVHIFEKNDVIENVKDTPVCGVTFQCHPFLRDMADSVCTLMGMWTLLYKVFFKINFCRKKKKKKLFTLGELVNLFPETLHVE